jgi:hypothetical protein
MADIDKIAKRPGAYLFETGVPQLTGGLIFFFSGASDLVRRFLPKTFVAQEAPKWLSICCCVAALWGAKALKGRVVFTRGGYVELPRKWQRFGLAAFAVFGIVLLFLAPFLAQSGHLPSLDGRLEDPGFAIVFAVVAVARGWREKSSLLTCFGVYLLCLAPLMWWLPVSSMEQGAVLEVGAGAPLAVGGAFILRRFLKANPRRLETSNE